MALEPQTPRDSFRGTAGAYRRYRESPERVLKRTCPTNLLLYGTVFNYVLAEFIEV